MQNANTEIQISFFNKVLRQQNAQILKNLDKKEGESQLFSVQLFFLCKARIWTMQTMWFVCFAANLINYSLSQDCNSRKTVVQNFRHARPDLICAVFAQL